MQHAEADRALLASTPLQVLPDDPATQRLKEDRAQLRKALKAAVEERNQANQRASALESQLRSARAVVCLLVKRLGGSVVVKRATLVGLRGELREHENKNGLTLTYVARKKKNARN